MSKSVVITVMVDDVTIEQVGEIDRSITDVLKEYEHKRVTIQIVNERLLPAPIAQR